MTGPEPPPQPSVPPNPSGEGGWRRWLASARRHPARASLAALALLAVVAVLAADALLAAPMRRWAERTLNANLNGYTVRLARVRPHLWRLGFELEGLVLTQDLHPEPPVADFGALRFSLAWGELLRLKVVGDLILERPALHINLAQIQQEAGSGVSLKDRGWQRAVEAIYPIKLNQVRIRDGSLVYLAAGAASKPLQLTQIAMVARNVRNIAAAKGSYPSPVSLEGVLFDTGKVTFKGAADFLREPRAAAQGELHLARVPLDRLDPLAQDYELRTKGGLLSVDGSLETTPEFQTAHLREVLLEQLQVDYVTSRATKAVEQAHGRQAAQVARRVRNAPKLGLRLDSLKLVDSQVGFVNQAARPPYRLFLSGVALELRNLSNQAGQGRSLFEMRGAFMGSGAMKASGGFQAVAQPADFNVRMAMNDARLTDLNPFMVAAAGVDVAAGRFSLFTEVKVKDGRLEGYVKPLVRDLKVYDRKKDKDKPLGKRVEMHVLQFLANVFKNARTQEVATVARLSGSTSQPRTSEWEAIRKLIANGFARAIRPGFLGKEKDPEKDPATKK